MIVPPVRPTRASCHGATYVCWTAARRATPDRTYQVRVIRILLEVYADPHLRVMTDTLLESKIRTWRPAPPHQRRERDDPRRGAGRRAGPAHRPRRDRELGPGPVRDRRDRRPPPPQAGTRARVSGGLAGRRVAFDVDVHRADDGGLALTAEGPVGLDVEYLVTARSPAGSEIRASVSVRRGDGLLGQRPGAGDRRAAVRRRARARPGAHHPRARRATWTSRCAA